MVLLEFIAPIFEFIASVKVLTLEFIAVTNSATSAAKSTCNGTLSSWLFSSASPCEITLADKFYTNIKKSCKKLGIQLRDQGNCSVAILLNRLHVDIFWLCFEERPRKVPRLLVDLKDLPVLREIALKDITNKTTDSLKSVVTPNSAEDEVNSGLQQYVLHE